MSSEVDKSETSVSDYSNRLHRSYLGKFIVEIFFMTVPDHITSSDHRHLLILILSILIISIVFLLTPDFGKRPEDRKVCCHWKCSRLLGIGFLLVELSCLFVLIELSIWRMLWLLLENWNDFGIFWFDLKAFETSASLWKICATTLPYSGSNRKLTESQIQSSCTMHSLAVDCEFFLL